MGRIEIARIEVGARAQFVHEIVKNCDLVKEKKQRKARLGEDFRNSTDTALLLRSRGQKNDPCCDTTFITINTIVR